MTGPWARRYGRDMSTADDVWVPPSCTLPTVEQPLRVAEFDQLLAESVRGLRRVDPTTLELTIAPAAEAEARDLAAREIGCCSFFTFDFTPGDEFLMLRVGVPAAHTAVLDAFETRAQRM